MGNKWTPEQKQAARDRYKARAEAQKQTPPEQNETTPLADAAQEEIQDSLKQAEMQPDEQEHVDMPDYGDIERRIDEMVQAKLRALGVVPNNNFQPWGQQAPGLQLGPQGQLIGTRVKYVLDPKRYPDPRERLSDEEALKRFAFRENYDMEWLVEVSSYTTKDGVNTREPRFTLKLRRIVFDDDTGLPTDKRYVIRQAIFHEDPDAAIAIANEKGYDIDNVNEPDFLDEMRYLRMRDWLFESFFSPRPRPQDKKQEVVVGNRVVQMFSINGADSQKIPFDEIKRATL